MSKFITLITNKSKESEAAIILVKQSNFPYKLIIGVGEDLPTAYFNGVSYQKGDNIETLVESLRTQPST